jgi:homoserine dehydrogenase
MAPGKSVIQIGMIGFGNVGQGVYRLLEKNRALIEAKVGAQILVKKILVRDPAKPRDVPVPDGMLTARYEDVVADPEIDVVLELMGGIEPTRSYLLDAMGRGKHIVTANKAVLSTHWDEIIETARQHKVDIYFEAAVCGGIPVIQALNDGLAANNILSIYGIVNGTTNFILQKMTEEKKSFKDALQTAQKKGLAEADPTLDINGMDAAHKLAILASLAFSKRVKVEDIYVEGIERITVQDIEFAREEFGRVVKLFAIAEAEGDELEVRVHPTLIPEDHLLAKVDGEYNGVLVTGDFVGTTMYYGLGAGSKPTASAVMSDLIYVCRSVSDNVAGEISNCWFLSDNPQIKRIKKMGDVTSRYYLKFTVLDQAGVLSNISRILGEHQISIASVIQKEQKKGDKVPVVIVTYEAIERNVQEALKKINGLPFVREETLLIRMDRGE